MTAVISLIAAAIGASAAIGAQFMQLRAARKLDAERERKHAVEEVIVRAGAVDLRAHETTLLAANAGSFNGTLARVLGTVVPLDYADMFDKLNREATALSRAGAQVWLFGDAQAVKLTNAVTLAATAVVDAHTQPRTHWGLNLLRVALLGKPLQDDHNVARTRQALAKARRDLVEHTRQQLNREDVDLFALPIESVE
jgi:hypothetical protein